MITSKYKIAEQIALRLSKDVVEAAPDYRELMLAVQQSFSTVVRKRYFENKANDVAEVDGGLIYTFKNIDVQYDSDTEQYYVELPGGLMSLPHGHSLKLIAPMKGLSKNYNNGGYRPVMNGFNDLYSGLKSSGLEGNIGHYIEGNYAYFVNMNVSNNPEKVMVKMILPLEGIEDDASINVPADMQDEIIEMVFSKYAQAESLPKDVVNDNLDQA